MESEKKPMSSPKLSSLTNCYAENVALLDGLLRVEENFDIIKKPLKVGKDEMTLYFVDGFIKDTVMMKLMLSFLALDGLTFPTEGRDDNHLVAALNFCTHALPYVETDVTDSVDAILGAGLSLRLGGGGGGCAVLPRPRHR